MDGDRTYEIGFTLASAEVCAFISSSPKPTSVQSLLWRWVVQNECHGVCAHVVGFKLPVFGGGLHTAQFEFLMTSIGVIEIFLGQQLHVLIHSTVCFKQASPAPAARSSSSCYLSPYLTLTGSFWVMLPPPPNVLEGSQVSWPWSIFTPPPSAC